MTWLVALPGLSVSVTDCNALCPIQHAPAIATVACGVLGALGNAGIPPGGLVNYVLLPFWLIGASVIMARRQRLTTRSPKHQA